MYNRIMNSVQKKIQKKTTTVKGKKYVTNN